ncbi:MAG: glycosyltransferase family protein, partial [Planctomycetota bacterium]
MNLLAITNNPNRASFRQRIGVYLETMRSNGINCEVAKLPSGYLARIKLFKRVADFDGVLLHKKGLNFFDAKILGRHSKKIIYNFDDAVMYSDKRPDRNSRSHFMPFRRSVKLADMVIVGNSYLAEHALRFNSNVKILPIGLKVSDYKLDCPPKDDDKIHLVWIGSKSTLSYLAEIKSVLEEIGVRFHNVSLRTICDDFFDLKNMTVEKRLWSKETRGINLATSDIGLAPLPNNRFTKGKCSFKVLEYASAGLP